MGMIYFIQTVEHTFEMVDIDIARELNKGDFTIQDIYEYYDAVYVEASCEL